MGIRMFFATLVSLSFTGLITAQPCKLTERSDDNFERPSVIEGKPVDVAAMHWFFEANGPHLWWKFAISGSGSTIRIPSILGVRG